MGSLQQKIEPATISNKFSCLYAQPLDTWNKNAEQLGFSVRHICKAKDYGTVKASTCPWMEAKLADKKKSIMFTEHCNTRYIYHYGKPASLDTRLNGTLFSGALPVTTGHVGFMFLKRSTSQHVIAIANQKTKKFVGILELSMTLGKVPSVWHVSISRDLQYVSVVTRSPRDLPLFDVHIYATDCLEAGLRHYRLVHVLGDQYSNRSIRSVLVTGSQEQAGYVVFPHAADPMFAKSICLYDIRTNQAISDNGLDDFCDSECTVQNIVTSPDDNLLFVSTEQEDMTKYMQVIIFQTWTLDILHMIQFTTQLDYWWNNEHLGCYFNTAPEFSVSGFEMALYSVKVPDVTNEGGSEPDEEGHVFVYSLPLLSMDLKSQCRKVILQNIKDYSSIGDLHIPRKLTEYLGFKY